MKLSIAALAICTMFAFTTAGAATGTDAAGRIVLAQRDVMPPIEGPGCPRQGTKSPRSSSAIPVTFYNSGDPANGTVEVHWVDFSGNSVLYGRVAPRQKLDLKSWAGHIFVVVNGRGRCINVITVPSSGTPTFGV
ncbi:MAG: hypothetical protein K2X71_25680 [Methylobacterium sp.]|uniref:hypothetical protein n=1 Tax=Methylobacterium sp. TaxID=409 RepID=UPI0025865DA2|nr:hypothetical protein [Methylobacterium sp.]MBY0299390.1 hypothetical protein [Methylobacterium sp.]